MFWKAALTVLNEQSWTKEPLKNIVYVEFNQVSPIGIAVGYNFHENNWRQLWLKHRSIWLKATILKRNTSALTALKVLSIGFKSATVG